MLLDTKDTTPSRVYVCPKCKAFFIDMKDLKVKP
jgi:hypothetical protein